MTQTLNHITLWAKAKFEYLTGMAAAAYGGFMVPDYQIVKAFMGSLLFCVVTGFMGALGAHLFKKLIEKINKNKHG